VLGILELIVNAVASLLAGVMLLRFWMQAVRVRPPESLSHFVFTLSDWLVRPLRRIVPGVGGYDWASLIGAFLIIALSTLVYLLLPGADMATLAKLACFRFLSWILYGLMLLLIVEAIFSWINPRAPLAPFVSALNLPVLKPLRRVVPLVGGIDLSFLVAVVLIQIAQHLLGMLFHL
jgi:YggT family protein